MGIFDAFKRNEKKELTKPELLSLANRDLRDVISEKIMKDIGRLEVSKCLERLSGAKRVFYIVSLYEAEVSTDGLCRYLVGPGRATAKYLPDALSEIHASRHAGLLRKFTSDNGIDLNDLSPLEISNSWEYEERRSMYPFGIFREKFEALYEKESIETRLMAYVRNHIDEFL